MAKYILKVDRVLWLSMHDLSEGQLVAIRVLHGENVEIVKDPVVFQDHKGLANYVRQHSEAFVYAVAGVPHYLYAALGGLQFGVFENHPAKRQDGTFGLAKVWHTANLQLELVWVNPDPESDNGEPLVPVARLP